MFKFAKRGDTIVCTEVSRLGRTMTIILEIMKMCLDRGITIRTLKENYILDDKPATKLILGVFGFAAETERNLISERTKEGLAAKKRAGFKLGRPVGSKAKTLKLDKYRDYIIVSLANGVKKMKIMRKCKCAYCTIYDYIQRRNIMEDVNEYVSLGKPKHWHKYN